MFVSAFIAGSVFPFSSEAVLLALLGMGLEPFPLFVYASVGNVMGAMLDFWIGRQGRLDWIEKYLHVKKEKLDRAERFMAGRGAWIGVLSFVPVLGSAITIMLGFMRADLWASILSITIGKVVRYAALIYSPLFLMWLYHQYT